MGRVLVIGACLAALGACGGDAAVTPASSEASAGIVSAAPESTRVVPESDERAATPPPVTVAPTTAPAPAAPATPALAPAPAGDPNVAVSLVDVYATRWSGEDSSVLVIATVDVTNHSTAWLDFMGTMSLAVVCPADGVVVGDRTYPSEPQLAEFGFPDFSEGTVVEQGGRATDRPRPILVYFDRQGCLSGAEELALVFDDGAEAGVVVDGGVGAGRDVVLPLGVDVAELVAAAG